MKKVLLCILALTFSLTTFAQERTFGVRAGLNISDLTAKMGGASSSSDSRASFHVGFAYQQPILRTLPLYFETGLYLSGRGGSDKEEGVKEKYNMLYLQVPALVSWHFNVRSVSIQPLVGVYYGFGVHGKLKVDDVKVDLFKEIEIEDTKGQIFKRSDFGLRFGAGVAIKKHYYVGLGYDLGLLNIGKDTGDVKFKNGSFFISLGYNF
ncbi:porin family protein [uncultured Alistipes sp.]|jgi:hypothetical protein|uniref:porin family protein n=1 Tax=uncultured Alistipes sp. TaxID=538949 RepID=UPI002600B4C1|nr:porin family protein [uncultured Alistipes sp.]